MSSEFPYVYIHRHNNMFCDGGCGKPAFFLTRKPKRTDRVSAKYVRHVDGSESKPYEMIKCDGCGKVKHGMSYQ